MNIVCKICVKVVKTKSIKNHSKLCKLREEIKDNVKDCYLQLKKIIPIVEIKKRAMGLKILMKRY